MDNKASQIQQTASEETSPLTRHDERLRVTQRDIAQRFGCDRSTVSLALSGHPRIRPEVRAKICALAEEMGYRPDPVLAMLAQHRFARQPAAFRGGIAWLVYSSATNYSEQVRDFPAAEEWAERRGYKIFEFDLASYCSGEAASRVLFNRGVQGVIVPKLCKAAETLLAAEGWFRFAVVSCGSNWPGLPFHTVAADLFGAMCSVWQEVVQRGYQRIGTVLFTSGPVAADDLVRYGAAIAQQEQLVSADQRLPILRCNAGDRAAFLEWFTRCRPEVVISSSEQVCEWLSAEGHRVPEDVAFVCLGARAGGYHTGRVLSTSALGKTVAGLVISLINDHQHGVPVTRQMLMLEGIWIEGSTLPWISPSTVAHSLHAQPDASPEFDRHFAIENV
ncbi:MAG TPA: LacI family DNA-binding transcriptional regulator [Opitutaceae bacterium]